MKNYMKGYIKEIDELIKSKEIKNIDKTIEQHLVKISFFSHERLIHFLVTMLFAILTVFSFLYTINNLRIELVLLDCLFLCLLVPYVFHYYFLENSVQYMYKQYDMLVERKK